MKNVSDFSFMPYGKNTVYYKGQDDDGKDYVLPDGYVVGETKYGEPAIFDKNNQFVHLIKSFGEPAIINNDNGLTIQLKLL